MTNTSNLIKVPAATLGLVSGHIVQKYQSVRGEKDFPSPPVAFRKPEVFRNFNHVRNDNYYWMKDRSNPMVIPYLKAENDYAEKVTSSTQALQDKIFNEMKQRLNEEDQSAPVWFNGYYYYTRTEKGKQYKIYCRKKGTLSAPENVLFDVNQMADGKNAFLFADYEVSPDNRHAAYLSNETGSYAEFILKVRDLETNKDIVGFEITKVQDVVWSNDSRTLFYTVSNASLRPWRVYRHDVFGSNPGVVVFQEDDDLFIVNLQKTKTSEYIFISSSSFSTTEFRMLNANTPFEEFAIFMPRVKDVDYGVYHHHEKFFIQYKDKENLNGKIFEVPVEDYADRNKWTEILPHDQDVLIDYMDVFSDFYAVQLRRDGLIEVRVVGMRCSFERTIKFPEPVYTVEINPLPDYHSKKLRYSYVSLNRPLTVYDYEPVEGISEMVKETVIPGGFNPDNYTVERLHSVAPDGSLIPMAVLYRNDLVKDGSNPALVYSYGAYGEPTDARFISTFYSLVDRGFVFALAQVRGGNDLGENWYEDGKLLKKKNTFNDFISCCEKLISDGYNSSSKLSIMGGSAGGLLVTAVTNMRPELFHTVVAVVPFVDVINTMLDPNLPLTTQEYEEWGNPNHKEYYDYMLSYSPYDNIGSFNYPNMIVTAGLNDSQVGFHEPAKYVAKLREYKRGDNLIILRTNMDSGHGGATGRFDALKEAAFELAFILEREGINE
ncbi:MAG TPA: S9 family peptidase [Lentimicrobium sp.]|nr:S9 family peptidase [Lentimicrobium sp.]